MKKIIVAPDSFKGSISAVQAAEIIAEEAKKVFPEAEVVTLPIADGGEGLVDTVLRLVGGKRHSVRVHDPLMREIFADYVELPDGSAIIEMAAAAGLTLLEEGERNVLHATTYGVGELILDAMEKGLKPIMVGLGGSATNDGGVGAAQAMGLQFWDANNKPVLHAQDLETIVKVIATGQFFRINQHRLIFLCDVRNPLCGPQGASQVFGPQKGASLKQADALDRGLEHLSKIIERQTKKDLRVKPGVGAAGGFALTFMGYSNAEIRSGIEFVLDLAEFDKELVGTDLVISGEGRTDAQSAMGKVISALASRCKAADVPLVLLSGSITPDAESLRDLGVTEMMPITPDDIPLEQAMREAAANLRLTARWLFTGIQPG